MAFVVKNPPTNAGDRFDPWVGETPWRRTWQPTPIFFPGESHGQRNWQTTVHGVATLITQDHAANRGQKQELSAKLGPLDSQLKIFYCYLIENV